MAKGRPFNVQREGKRAAGKTEPPSSLSSRAWRVSRVFQHLELVFPDLKVEPIPENCQLAKALDLLEGHSPIAIVREPRRVNQPRRSLFSDEERGHRQPHLIDQPRAQKLRVD